jgi:carboxyl-terminal processing protease
MKRHGRRSAFLFSIPLVALAAALGCPSGSSSSQSSCGPEVEKAAVLWLAREYYLFPEHLPTDVDLAAYASAAELLHALTAEAREERKDRGWSYVTTRAAQQSFFVEGESVGFGLGLLLPGDRPGRLFVSQVYRHSPDGYSPANEARFLRGDEILAIGDTPGALVPVADLLDSGTLGGALGPPEEGVTRSFAVVPRGSEASEIREMAKGIFLLEPVPEWRVIDRSEAGLPPAGYLALRTFIGPAEQRLEQAVAEFSASGVTDVVIDLRYNGGGLVRTAERLANLLAGGLDGTPMYALEHNPAQSRWDGTVPFSPGEESMAPGRIAFITTGASASASELVPNVLEPAGNVALVGSRTYGKPVGQYPFALRGCDTIAYLVSFRLANAEGDGDYFSGLPDADGRFAGPLCAAADDLARETSDEDETSTAAALHWLAAGECPGPPEAFAKPLRVRAEVREDAYPEAPSPSEAQRHVRGLF